MTEQNPYENIMYNIADQMIKNNPKFRKNILKNTYYELLHELLYLTATEQELKLIVDELINLNYFDSYSFVTSQFVHIFEHMTTRNYSPKKIKQILRLIYKISNEYSQKVTKIVEILSKYHNPQFLIEYMKTFNNYMGVQEFKKIIANGRESHWEQIIENFIPDKYSCLSEALTNVLNCKAVKFFYNSGIINQYLIEEILLLAIRRHDYNTAKTCLSFDLDFTYTTQRACLHWILNNQASGVSKMLQHLINYGFDIDYFYKKEPELHMALRVITQCIIHYKINPNCLLKSNKFKKLNIKSKIQILNNLKYHPQLYNNDNIQKELAKISLQIL